ncbi:MAG: TrkH family potassium uptake protein [Gammaproteobacteria bacterium]|nr:TrkH family potassium uptake protein [Gammaproteobacteria bacterium]
MSARVVQRVIGILLMIFSTTMLPALLVSIFYADHEHMAFIGGFAITALSGLILWFPARNATDDLRLRDGFLVVAGFWIVLGLAGAVPFILADQLDMQPVDAIFESISGLTTTGATVLTGLDLLPESILYYRQQLQWLGGMGIIVLAVAVLPMLGVGGMQLYRAETPGPVKDTKLTPRITETAKALWYIYVGITVVCILAYAAAGMTIFDAIGHGFSTVAIGGFSTHDASMAYFESPLIEMIAVVFMFIAGINFSLHFVAWRKATIVNYLRDPEFRAFVTVLGTLTALTTIYLMATGYYPTITESFTKAIFQAVSIGTTTGFTTADYSAWPGSLPVALILASFIGGCAGSTGGGMKVIRWLLVFKQGMREVRQLVHPSATIPVKVGSKAVSERVIGAVWGFFAVYIILFGVMMLLLMVTGLDQVTAFSAVAATLNNLGPGMGDVAGNFASVGPLAKIVSIAAMLLGRLEIFTLFVLFTPTFWNR